MGAHDGHRRRGRSQPRSRHLSPSGSGWEDGGSHVGHRRRHEQHCHPSPIPPPHRAADRHAGALPVPGRRARPHERLLHGGPRRAAGDRLPRRRGAGPPRRLGPRPRRAGRQPAASRPLRAGDGAGDDACTRYWIGIAAELERAGDTSLRWILEAAVDGEVFAAGHAEAGNDIPVLLSTCQAERVEGGYRLTGRKQFGSNGPAWRWLGAHAIDAAAPGGPQIVHAFVERDEPGRDGRRDVGHARHAPDPEPRHGARRRVRPRRPHRAGRPGRRRQRPVHRGHGDVAAVAHRRRLPRDRRPGARAGRRRRPRARRRWPSPRGAYAYNPMVQHQVAEMYLELDAASATVDRFVDDWVAGADHGDAWVPKVYSMKWRAVEAAKRVVDVALDVAGGAGMMTRQRAGAPLPRRALRRLPPRQRRPDPRAGRQGRARHPRRAAAVVTVAHERRAGRARRRRRRRARRPRRSAAS